MNQVKESPSHLIRVGVTRIDGGCLFGAVAKERWEAFRSPDRQNRISVGIYCMLVSHPDGWILVDAGPGDKDPRPMEAAPMRGRSSLLRDLRDLNVAPREIATVVLTHLHGQHAGGATYGTYSGRLMPTFPNARYVVQRAAWEEACHPNERNSRHYRCDDFMPLEESGQLDLVDGREEIAPRVWVEPAPGPAAGHQILITERARATVAFLGALVPTLMHLTPGVVSAADRDPDETVASKHSVLRRAVAHRWSLAAAGSDRVLAAEEVLDLALWREATAPVQRERVPQHAVAAMAV